jgi:hypothetical protein
MTAPAPVWLLELTINGRVERFATRSSIVADDGVELQFREGLAELSFTLAAIDAGGEISVPITIDADALENVRLERDDLRAGGWAALVAALHDIEGAEGILYRWTPGTTIGEARVMLRGFAEEVEHGGRLEPLVFTLRRLLFAGSRPVLDSQARVDASTWPILVGSNRFTDEKIIGQNYPRIYSARTTRGSTVTRGALIRRFSFSGLGRRPSCLDFWPATATRAAVPVTSSSPMGRSRRPRFTFGILTATLRPSTCSTCSRSTTCSGELFRS